MAILDQSERVHLYNHLSKYTKKKIILYFHIYIITLSTGSLSMMQ